MDHETIMKEARRVADELRSDALERDQTKTFPARGIEVLKASPLHGLMIAEHLGGLGGNVRDFVFVVEELANGDPSVAQMYGVHVTAIDTVRGGAPTDVYEAFATDVIRDRLWVSNAQAEIGTKTNRDFRTTLQSVEGGWEMTGTKFYCTGSLAADYFVGGAATGDPAKPFLMYLAKVDQDGVEVVDDWTGMGQRGTASGTVEFKNAHVRAEHAFGLEGLISATELAAVILQGYFTAIFVGIARAALDDAISYVNERARPWPTAGVDRAAEDPLVQLRVGDMHIRLLGAAALLDRATHAMLDAQANATEATRGAASLAMASAKVAATDAVLSITETMFLVCGSSATLEKYDFDRHWRNARTLTLHDAVDHKRRIIGDAVLRDGWPAPGPWS